MKLPAMIRVLALTILAAMAATACAASETVIIADGVVESATATALRNIPAPTVSAAAGAPEEAAASGASDSATDPTPAPFAGGSGTGQDGCVYLGVDSFDDMQIELAFTSPLDTQSDATVDYEVLSASGDTLVDGSHWIEDLVPGENVRISVDTVTDEPAGRTGGSGITCNIIEIEGSPFDSDGFAPGPDDSCAFVEVDSFDDIQIRIDVISPEGASGNLAVDYALRGPDGTRFEDGVAFVEIVGRGELSSTPVDTFTEFPTWVNESTFRCQILSIQEF